MKFFVERLLFRVLTPLFILVAHPIHSNEVCYSELGCFSNSAPWSSLLRPIPPPMSPERINTRIYFYSHLNPEIRYEILLWPNVDLNGAPLSLSSPTLIITHGFINNGNSTWMSDLKDAWLNTVDGNVMLVDWGPGATLLNYLQVSGNTRVVGKEIARMVNELGIDPRKLHLVGHSLGAQISSYAANAIPGTARITALDPAQPAFEGYDEEVRLDRNDAAFVDVIHTDARPFIPLLGLGMMSTVGDVDFYMNGGAIQPGCFIPDPTKLPFIKSILDLVKFPIEIIANMGTCSHQRSYEYLIEALKKTHQCVLWGRKSNLVSDILSPFVKPCLLSDCSPVGLFTESSPLRGRFVVTTNGREPFCKPG